MIKIPSKTHRNFNVIKATYAKVTQITVIYGERSGTVYV